MSQPDRKIIDIIKDNQNNGSKPLVSLEYFPPRTAEGVQNLYTRMERMKNTLSPAFTDVTWGAGGSTADLSLELALRAHQTGHVANLHMTCTNLQPPPPTNNDNDDNNNKKNHPQTPKDAILQALTAAHNGGIRNIVALRGDPPAGETEWKAAKGGFTCALDLVKFIRQHFGHEMGISVAGYPEGHPNAITEIFDPTTLTERERARSSNFDGKTYCCLEADYKKEMDYLKEKVDAGADFIITQMFFDTEIFKAFVQDCRDWGIECPVVPGLMCINAYAGFAKMTKFCKTRVPPALQEKMDSIQNDAAAVKDFGIEFGTQMCRELVDSGLIEVLHFYTLNLEKVVYGVLDGLGWSQNASSSTNEADAASQVAKGSAWARVGDRVKTPYGEGVVLELTEATGAAKVNLDDASQAPENPVIVEKSNYSKVF